jgi:hypothetical protein
MMDSTDKMPALDWSLPADDETEEELDFDLSDASDGELWEWNGTAWVMVQP